ncbi:MAG: hydrolase, partial [Bacteroidales bacterium]|nr:hydrolase [Bacteroidales bacterium]
MKKLLLFFTTLALLLLCGSEICSASVPSPTDEWLYDNYSKREVYIPARDGVRLHTAVYEPKDSLQHPVIMIRTPYGVGPYGEQLPGSLRSWMKMFALNRYIIVFQSVRG